MGTVSTASLQRWYVEVDNRSRVNDGWQRQPGKWVFEAAVAKAREIAVNGMIWTRLVKA